jgi:DNA replication protein DnaC
LERRGLRTNPQLLRLRDPRGHLKLLPAQERLEALLQDARAQEVPDANFLDRRRTDEMMATGEKAVALRTVMARLPDRNTLASVDDGGQPSVDRKKLQDLATGRFLDHGAKSVFLGPPRTGNPLVAMGLGLKAVQPGHRTLVTSALSRIATLPKA